MTPVPTTATCRSSPIVARSVPHSAGVARVSIQRAWVKERAGRGDRVRGGPAQDLLHRNLKLLPGAAVGDGWNSDDLVGNMPRRQGGSHVTSETLAQGVAKFDAVGKHDEQQ